MEQIFLKEKAVCGDILSKLNDFCHDLTENETSDLSGDWCILINDGLPEKDKFTDVRIEHLSGADEMKKLFYEEGLSEFADDEKNIMIGSAVADDCFELNYCKTGSENKETSLKFIPVEYMWEFFYDRDERFDCLLSVEPELLEVMVNDPFDDVTKTSFYDNLGKYKMTKEKESRQIVSGNFVYADIKISIADNLTDVTQGELNLYIKYAKSRLSEGHSLNELRLEPAGGDSVMVQYGASSEPFERIRRITGYLVGTLDRWNNAKKAEEKERVKHTGGRGL